MPRQSVNKNVPIISGYSTLASLAHDVNKLKPGQVLRYRAVAEGKDRHLQAKKVTLKDWVLRCKAKQLLKQCEEYQELAEHIQNLVPAEFIADPGVAKAAEAVDDLITFSWLHRDELAKKLNNLNQAVIEAEKRNTNALQSRAQDNLNQLVHSAESGNPPSPDQLAKTIFQPPGGPGEEVVFKHKVFEAILNEHAPVNGDYAMGNSLDAAKERQALVERLEKGQKKLDKNDRATKNLTDAFTQIGQSTQRLADYQTRCKEALTQEQVDAEQLHALYALDALGQSPNLKKAMGSGFHGRSKPDDPNPGIALGLSAFVALGSQVNQALTRMALPANELLRNANAYTNAIQKPDPQNPPDQHLVAFQSACKEQVKSYQSALQNVLHVAHYLINASEHFPTISAELKQLLQEHGKCLLAVVAAVSDRSQATSLPYVSLYELAKWGQQDPKAALTALVQAAQAATPPAQDPVQVVPPQVPAQEPLERKPEPMSKKELDARLDGIMAEFDNVQRSQADDAQHLTQLMKVLEERESLAQLMETLEQREKRAPDIGDPGESLSNQPMAAAPDESISTLTPRATAWQQIQSDTERLRALADFLTKSPDELKSSVVDTAAALRINRALDKAPLPKGWIIRVPKKPGSQLPADLKRGAAISYALTEGPERLEKLSEQTQALMQKRDEAQGKNLDGSIASELTSAVASFRQTYGTTVKWLESRATHLRSKRFLKAFSEEDQRTLARYGASLAAMAQVLRDPQSTEGRLYTLTQPKEVVKRHAPENLNNAAIEPGTAPQVQKDAAREPPLRSNCTAPGETSASPEKNPSDDAPAAEVDEVEELLARMDQEAIFLSDQTSLLNTPRGQGEPVPTAPRTEGDFPPIKDGTLIRSDLATALAALKDAEFTVETPREPQTPSITSAAIADPSNLTPRSFAAQELETLMHDMEAGKGAPPLNAHLLGKKAPQLQTREELVPRSRPVSMVRPPSQTEASRAGHVASKRRSRVGSLVKRLTLNLSNKASGPGGV